MKNFSNTTKVYGLLEKKFITQNEYNYLIEIPDVVYEDCGASTSQPGYSWIIVTYNNDYYNIYVEGGK